MDCFNLTGKSQSRRLKPRGYWVEVDNKLGIIVKHYLLAVLLYLGSMEDCESVTCPPRAISDMYDAPESDVRARLEPTRDMNPPRPQVSSSESPS